MHKFHQDMYWQFLLFEFRRGKLLSSLNPRQQSLRCGLSPQRNPISCRPLLNIAFWPRGHVFFLARHVQLKVLTFTNQLLFVLVLDHLLSVLTNEWVAFFSRCVSCACAKIKDVILDGSRGTTLLMKIRLCLLNWSFCRSDPFPASEFFWTWQYFFTMSWDGLFV